MATVRTVEERLAPLTWLRTQPATDCADSAFVRILQSTLLLIFVATGCQGSTSDSAPAPAQTTTLTGSNLSSPTKQLIGVWQPKYSARAIEFRENGEWSVNEPTIVVAGSYHWVDANHIEIATVDSEHGSRKFGLVGEKYRVVLDGEVLRMIDDHANIETYTRPDPEAYASVLFIQQSWADRMCDCRDLDCANQFMKEEILRPGPGHEVPLMTAEQADHLSTVKAKRAECYDIHIKKKQAL
jgi:hypothetical protein